MKTLIVLSTLCTLYVCVLSQCRFSPKIISKGEPGKPFEINCEYQGQKWDSGVKLFLDTCEECFCQDRRMQCCSMSNLAGAKEKEGCIALRIKDSCELTFVQKEDDKFVDCDTGKVLESISPNGLF